MKSTRTKIFAVSTLIPALFTIVPATAPAASSRTINVTGECQKKVMPDRGRITLTMTEVLPDIASVSKKVMSEYENLRKDIHDLKLKDGELETSEYSVQEESDWNNGKKIHKGFRASMGLLVTTSDIARFSDVILLASKHGVQQVENFTTYLSPEKTKSTHQECLHEAILDAREKAEKMAGDVGGHAGEVISIDENPRQGGVEPRAYAAMAPKAMAESHLSPQIETKPEEVSVGIAMSVELH